MCIEHSLAVLSTTSHDYHRSYILFFHVPCMLNIYDTDIFSHQEPHYDERLVVAIYLNLMRDYDNYLNSIDQ